MAKTTKSAGRSAGTYTVGRERFSKISAVEGIRTSRRVDQDFREFDQKGLSPEERRRELASKYGRKR
jgi:hypothetical protein